MDTRAARLRGFLVADPTNVDLACELADVLIAGGDHAQARETLEALPEAARAAPGVRFRLGRCALLQGEYAAAEALYAGLLASGSDVVAVAHDLAFSQLCQRRPEDAWTTVQDAIARHGGDVALAILRARIALMLERYDDALASLDEVLAIEPDNANAWGVRALALLDASELGSAGEAAQGALQRDPEQHEALLVAGSLALWRQDVAVAERHFGSAARRFPNSGRALSGLGQVQLLQRDLTGAQQTLQAAVAAMPDHIGTWHALAWAQLLQADHAGAQHSYEQAYAIDRNFGDTHGGLALVAALRGDIAEAEQGIRRALRLDPAATTALYAQTLVQEAHGDTAGAEATLARLLQGNPAAGMPIPEFAARLKRTLGHRAS